MEKQLDQYLDNIRNDYRSWQSDSLTTGSPVYDEVRTQMTEDFCQGVRYEEGRKYIKVIHGSSVHSFIVKDDDAKFKKGDILKAASWNTPARNFSRGNILTGGYTVRWTGAL